MKCRKCGNPVRETEQRCSLCGARVIKEPLSLSKKKKSPSVGDMNSSEDWEFRGYIPPAEKFGWNTEGFPGEKKPTKDIEFNWNAFNQFHQNEEKATAFKDGEEIVFGEDLLPGLEEETEPEKEKVVWNEPFEIPVAPEDVMGNSKAVQEALPQEEPPEKEEEPADEEVQEPAFAEEPMTGESDVTGQQLEEELFEEIRKEQRSAPSPVSMTDAMAAHTVSTEETDHGQVDQFYTFNRKNEEFQRLLDKEYEKYRSGRRDSDWEPEEYSSADCDQDVVVPSEANIPAHLAALLKEQEDEAKEDLSVMSPDSMIAENASLESVLSEEHSEETETTETTTSSDNREAINSTEIPPDMQVRTDGEVQIATSKAQSEENTQQETPEAPPAAAAEKVASTKESPAPESKMESAPEGKSKKSRPWIMIILIIVLVGLVLLATALAAPNSPPGTWIHSIFGNSRVENQEPVPVKSSSQKAAKDKTGLIQLVMKEKQDWALTTVAYGSKLQYDDKQVYKDKEIKTSKLLEKNEKRKNEQGKEESLDKALVKATIDFADSRMKPRGKEKELKIGEIRYTDKAYYVWVSENDIQKIYKIDNSKGTLQVSGIISM